MNANNVAMSLRETPDGWVCPECGEAHVGLITCFGPDEPHAWFNASPMARLTGALDDSVGWVKVKGQYKYYVRGHLRIPLRGHADPVFIWNVWAEVAKADFDRMMDTWEDPRRVDLPAIEGTLDTPLPYEPDTQGLSVELHERPPGEVPHVTLTRCSGHPLQTEQEDGIDAARLAQINHEVLG